MSCFCWCFNKTRPRYKQVVLALFPDDDSFDESDKKPNSAPTAGGGAGGAGGAASASGAAPPLPLVGNQHRSGNNLTAPNTATAATTGTAATAAGTGSGVPPPTAATASANASGSAPGATNAASPHGAAGGGASNIGTPLTVNGVAPPSAIGGGRPSIAMAAGAGAATPVGAGAGGGGGGNPHPAIGLPSDAGDEAVAPQNVGDLIAYAHAFPPKLPLIGKYMLKLVKENIKKHRSKKVQCLLIAFQYLMEDTKLTLAVYDDSVCASILLCLQHPNPKLKMLAAQTFSKFMNYQADGSDYKKLDPFFDALVDLCRYVSAEDRHIQRTVRTYGLKAVKNMVLYNDPQRAVDHFDDLVPAVLINLPAVFPFDNAARLAAAAAAAAAAGDDRKQAEARIAAAADETLESVAFDTFTKVAARPSVAQVMRLLEPVMRALDETFWLPHSFAVQCMQLLSNEAQFSGDLLCFSILRHLDDIEREQMIADRARLAEAHASAAAAIAQQKKDPKKPAAAPAPAPAASSAGAKAAAKPEKSRFKWSAFLNRGGNSSKPDGAAGVINDSAATKQHMIVMRTRIINVVSDLLRIMRLNIETWQASIQFLLSKLEQSHNIALDSWTPLAASIVRCLGVYSLKVQQPEDCMEMLSLIMEQCKSLTIGQADLSRRAYLQSALTVSRLKRPLKDNYSAPDSLVIALISCLVLQDDPDIRCSVYQIIHNILLPPDAAAADPSLSQSEQIPSASSSRAAGGAGGAAGTGALVSATPSSSSDEKKHAHAMNGVPIAPSANPLSPVGMNGVSISSIGATSVEEAMDRSRVERFLLSLSGPKNIDIRDSKSPVGGKHRIWLTHAIYNELRGQNGKPPPDEQFGHDRSHSHGGAGGSGAATGLGTVSSNSTVIGLGDIKLMESSNAAGGGSAFASTGRIASGEVTPACFENAFRVLITLLAYDPYRQLMNQIPLIFHLQEHAKRIKNRDETVNRLHSFVLAYFLFVARVFLQLDKPEDQRRSAAELEESVNKIIAKRKEKNQFAVGLEISSQFGLIAVPESDEQKRAATVDVFIDRVAIVPILAQFRAPKKYKPASGKPSTNPGGSSGVIAPSPTGLNAHHMLTSNAGGANNSKQNLLIGAGAATPTGNANATASGTGPTAGGGGLDGTALSSSGGVSGGGVGTSNPSAVTINTNTGGGGGVGASSSGAGSGDEEDGDLQQRLMGAYAEYDLHALLRTEEKSNDRESSIRRESDAIPVGRTPPPESPRVDSVRQPAGGFGTGKDRDSFTINPNEKENAEKLRSLEDGSSSFADLATSIDSARTKETLKVRSFFNSVDSNGLNSGSHPPRSATAGGANAGASNNSGPSEVMLTTFRGGSGGSLGLGSLIAPQSAPAAAPTAAPVMLPLTSTAPIATAAPEPAAAVATDASSVAIGTAPTASAAPAVADPLANTLMGSLAATTATATAAAAPSAVPGMASATPPAATAGDSLLGLGTAAAYDDPTDDAESHDAATSTLNRHDPELRLYDDAAF